MKKFTTPISVVIIRIYHCSCGCNANQNQEPRKETKHEITERNSNRTQRNFYALAVFQNVKQTWSTVFLESSHFTA